MDLSILKENPKLRDTKAKLIIEPLAPLSIVENLPGAYYKSLDAPTKTNLCGIFENILGWHLGAKDRGKLQKAMTAHYKKTYKLTDIEYHTSHSSYVPLLGHLFDIDFVIKPHIEFRYDDIWKQQLYRDGYAHPNGTPNLDYRLIPLKLDLKRDDKGKITGKAIGDFHKEYQGQYPQYYTSPKKREYIQVKGQYEYNLSLSELLFDTLAERIAVNNVGYIGNSEGWVNLKIEKI